MSTKQNKRAVVAVCPTCGNYPMVCTAEKHVLKDAKDSIIELIADGFNIVHIDLTAEAREKLLACKCEEEYAQLSL